MLQDESYAVLRFRADNPGVWMFHCHTELHVGSGLTVTMIEAPDLITKRNAAITQGEKDLCSAYPMKYSGNSDGDTKNVLDAKAHAVPTVNWGAMYPPGSLPYVAKNTGSQCKK
jgi:iron transport multicopper oxidase